MNKGLFLSDYRPLLSEFQALLNAYRALLRKYTGLYEESIAICLVCIELFRMNIDLF